MTQSAIAAPTHQNDRAALPRLVRSLKRALLLTTILIPTALTTSCSSMTRTRVEQGSAEGIADAKTVAWLTEPTAFDHSGSPLDDPTQVRELRESVESQLAESGITLRERRTGADLHVLAQLSIRREPRSANPVFMPFDARMFEIARIELRFLDPRSGELRWLGSAERELRMAGIGLGLYDQRFSDSGEPRDWQVPTMVTKLFERLE